MAITLTTALGDVVLDEMWDGYDKGIDFASPWVRKRYLLKDNTKVNAVVNALRGGVAASTVGGPITRTYAHPCPESTNLICQDARAAGVPGAEVGVGAGGMPQYSLWTIDAEYRVPTWEQFITDDPGGLNQFDPATPYTFATQSIDFDVEVIKLPGSAYKFHTAPQFPLDVPTSCSVAVANLVFVRRQVPYFPVGDILSKLNKLNNATFLGQPTGLIKFVKARSNREAASDGTRTQEIELVFKFRQYDHCKMHRPDSATFDFIEDSSGARPYQYADLTPLLS